MKAELSEDKRKAVNASRDITRLVGSEGRTADAVDVAIAGAAEEGRVAGEVEGGIEGRAAYRTKTLLRSACERADYECVSRLMRGSR